MIGSYNLNNSKILGIVLIIVIALINCSHAPQTGQQIDSKIVQKKSVAPNLSQVNPKVLNHIMDGQFYLEHGDFAMAIIELQEAQQLEPNVSEIYVALAECYWNLKKPAKSTEYLETALEIDSKNTAARETMAEQYYRLGDFPNAEEQYKILYQLNPEEKDYLFALSDLAKIQKKYDLASDYYQQIYEKHNSTTALELNADLAFRLKKFEEAASLYHKLLQIDSLNINYLNNYADVLVQSGKADEALSVVKKIVEIEDSSTQSLIQIGVLYADQDKNSEALNVFHKILKHDSTNTAALHFLATIYRETEDYGKADQYAKIMQRIYPDNPQGFVNGAFIAFAQDDNESAIEILSNVVADFPDDYSVQYLLGLGYYQIEDYKMANLYLTNAREIAPNSRNAMHILAIVNDNLDNWEVSDGLYEQLIQSDSTDAQAYNNYAYSLIERGEKIELSKTYSKRAIKLAPDQAAYLDTYGWILFKLGMSEEALQYINKSLEINNENSEVLEHKGDILLKLKNIVGAKEYYQKALLHDPENAELLEKINNL